MSNHTGVPDSFESHLNMIVDKKGDCDAMSTQPTPHRRRATLDTFMATESTDDEFELQDPTSESDDDQPVADPAHYDDDPTSDHSDEESSTSAKPWKDLVRPKAATIVLLTLGLIASLFIGFSLSRPYIGGVAALVFFNGIVLTLYLDKRKRDEQVRLNAEQLETDEFAELKSEFDELGNRARELVFHYKVKLKLTVANEDGGVGKTFLSNALATEAADLLRKLVTLIESRRGTAFGMETLGIPVEDTVTIRQLYELMPEITDADSFEQATSSNKFGVVGIAADTKIPKNDTFDGEKARKVVALCDRMGRLSVRDTGNSPSDEINVGMCQDANVGVFVSRPGRISSMASCSTRETFSSQGLGHLVDRGILVVNVLRPGQSAEDFRENLDPDESMPLYGVRSDPYVEPENVIDPYKWQFETRLDIRRILVAALEQAYLQQTDAPAPAHTVVDHPVNDTQADADNGAQEGSAS